MADTGFANHFESTTRLRAPIEVAFAYLDDFRKLSSHMQQPSGMMMGARMHLEVDAADGRAVGSVVGMQGNILGIPLSLREVVTERSPPTRKVWRTIDVDLLVIGPYSLGFELGEQGAQTNLRVFIDYDQPDSGVSRLLGRLFARSYARWCVERMVTDAAHYFRTASASANADGS